MPKRPSLATFAARKPEPASAPSAQEHPTAGANEKAQRTGQTLRLRKEAWRQLRQLALELEAQRDTRVHQHDLLIEAVNDLFRKYDRPPIA
jgi:hypothetical protein